MRALLSSGTPWLDTPSSSLPLPSATSRTHPIDTRSSNAIDKQCGYFNPRTHDRYARTLGSRLAAAFGAAWTAGFRRFSLKGERPQEVAGRVGERGTNECRRYRMPTDPVVFVLEDDPGIATLVRRVCANAGLPARFFSAAADFLKEEDIDAGSLILLDLGLNDTTGVDVLRSLAARRCPAPVYLMSGRDDRLLKSVQKLGQSYGLDVRGILQKPFRLRDLQE